MKEDSVLLLHTLGTLEFLRGLNFVLAVIFLTVNIFPAFCSLLHCLYFLIWKSLLGRVFPWALIEGWAPGKAAESK